MSGRWGSRSAHPGTVWTREAGDIVLLVVEYTTGERTWGVFPAQPRPGWGMAANEAPTLEAAMRAAEQEAERRAMAVLEALESPIIARIRVHRAERLAWTRQRESVMRMWGPLTRAAHDLAAVLGGEAGGVNGSELLALGEFVATLAAKVRATPLGGS